MNNPTNIDDLKPEFDTGIRPYVNDDGFETAQRVRTAAEVQTVNPYPESETAPPYMNPDDGYEAVEYKWPQGITIPNIDIDVPNYEFPDVPITPVPSSRLCCHAWTNDCYVSGGVASIMISVGNCPSVVMDGKKYVDWECTEVKLTFSIDESRFRIIGFSGGIGGCFVRIAAKETAWSKLSLTVKMRVADTEQNRLSSAPIKSPCLAIIDVDKCDDSECDCSDGMSWDTATSALEINRSSGVAIGIIANSEKCAPFTWAVSGTGFSLAFSVTSGLQNVLYADGTACGMAIVTVTGCDGVTQVIGKVRCTFGTWVVCEYINLPYTPVVGNCTSASCTISISTSGDVSYFYTASGDLRLGRYRHPMCANCPSSTGANPTVTCPIGTFLVSDVFETGVTPWNPFQIVWPPHYTRRDTYGWIRGEYWTC
jgi:hypothetical protein